MTPAIMPSPTFSAFGLRRRRTPFASCRLSVLRVLRRFSFFALFRLPLLVALSGSVAMNVSPACTSASVAARPKIRRYAFWMRAVLSGSFGDLAREQLALLLHEIAVHEEQPLQRHAGREALLGREVRAREIEQLQVFVELVAADLAVDRAPVERRRQRRRRPAHLRIERARDEQQRIANLLGGHPVAIRAPVQAVARSPSRSSAAS